MNFRTLISREKFLLWEIKNSVNFFIAAILEIHYITWVKELQKPDKLFLKKKSMYTERRAEGQKTSYFIFFSIYKFHFCIALWRHQYFYISIITNFIFLQCSHTPLHPAVSSRKCARSQEQTCHWKIIDSVKVRRGPLRVQQPSPDIRAKHPWYLSVVVNNIINLCVLFISFRT